MKKIFDCFRLWIIDFRIRGLYIERSYYLTARRLRELNGIERWKLSKLESKIDMLELAERDIQLSHDW